MKFNCWIFELTYFFSRLGSDVTAEAMGSKPGTSMKATQKDFLNWCLENGWDVDGSVDEKGA